MSRLEAKAKMLYYPTPDPIVEAVAGYLSTQSYSTVRFLDPCAGTGHALALLAQRVKERHEVVQPDTSRSTTTVTIETYGIEPELLRAKAAYSCLTQVLQASFFSTTLSNGEGLDGGWQCVFLNPPYDTDTENTKANGRKTRLEVNFLHRATLKLCPEGILIWIVPQHSLHAASTFLASSYERITCFRFPDTTWTPEAGGDPISMYDQFKQIVLMAKKRRYAVPAHPTLVQQIEQWAAAGSSEKVPPGSNRRLSHLSQWLKFNVIP